MTWQELSSFIDWALVNVRCVQINPGCMQHHYIDMHKHALLAIKVPQLGLVSARCVPRLPARTHARALSTAAVLCAARCAACVLRLPGSAHVKGTRSSCPVRRLGRGSSPMGRLDLAVAVPTSSTRRNTSLSLSPLPAGSRCGSSLQALGPYVHHLWRLCAIPVPIDCPAVPARMHPPRDSLLAHLATTSKLHRPLIPPSHTLRPPCTRACEINHGGVRGDGAAPPGALPEFMRLVRQEAPKTFNDVMAEMQMRNKMEAAKPLLQVGPALHNAGLASVVFQLPAG